VSKVRLVSICARDWATLQAAMEKEGFLNVTSFRPGESTDKDLRGIESHGKSIGDEMNRFETIVVEATRK